MEGRLKNSKKNPKKERKANHKAKLVKRSKINPNKEEANKVRRHQHANSQSQSTLHKETNNKNRSSIHFSRIPTIIKGSLSKNIITSKIFKTRC